MQWMGVLLCWFDSSLWLVRTSQWLEGTMIIANGPLIKLNWGGAMRGRAEEGDNWTN